MNGIPRHALLLEDLPEVADWLTALLCQRFAGVQVAHAATLAAGHRHLDDGPSPQLALVDLGLPDGSGVELIARLSRQHPACTIVVTTLFADDAHVFPALRAGAHGYLLKDQPEERLGAALDGILRGEPPLSPSIARRLLRSFAEPPAPASAEAEKLTAREREVLVLVSKGCRLPELAEKLRISRHTVSDHLKSIYRKLNVNSRAEAALEAARLGLVASPR
ncbi:DNA-binding response regulator [Pseudoxanthomonas broegbernensis]|uniref:DNA-binding response regulator n=1 Tax=Pseudoxanthomonas broegbernensis TaxID=83619 RepID=A0A7V8GMD2_9GAMM|nr:response regulator transcription factor [Pseudoxanthomonas broegbernensis]KAF1686322.1 DNA-binding response regulator [Pseudoxanthomonas broegbernensis]MBB6064009.1 DNA-binding NarL/FixJ family response regulator [Pseudoxanthomonas broegbernensis]